VILSFGETASSKSKKIKSAAEFKAFSNIWGEEPGTASSLLCNLDRAGL
jgi:hypothetical protein